MAPLRSKHNVELDLASLIPAPGTSFTEDTLASLQVSLETLLSDQSHPILTKLRRQLDVLKNAESIIGHETEVRKSRASGAASVESDTILGKRKSSDDARDFNNHTTSTLDSTSNSTINNTANSTVNTVDSVENFESSNQNSQDIKVESPVNFNDLNADENDLTSNNDKETTTTTNTTSPQQNSNNTSQSIGNGRFVPNPKAEFVDAQTLPLELYTEPEDIGSDEDAIKKKLGVVSYPKEDLSTLTAGPVPMDDFTGPRPTNQVLFSTYAAFVEPYFRAFTEDDLLLLQQPTVSDGFEGANLLGGKKLSPFTIPPLGPHYKYQWAIQDAELSGVEVPANVREAQQLYLQKLAHSYVPLKGLTDISANNLESDVNSVSLGPFSERLVAAVMPDPLSTEWDLDAESAILPSNGVLQPIDDFSHLEERVKGEFRYVGLLDLSVLRQFERKKADFKLALPNPRDEFSDPTAIEVDWVNGAEDDEICRELRVLQRKLKEINKRNNFYKQRLIGPLQEQLAWQEYQSILQDLDKQVDQGYQRRLKSPKVSAPKNKRKKSDEHDSGNVIEQKLPDQNLAIKAVLNKRERWINKIGPLFKPAYEMMRGYEVPKFNGVENVDDFDDDEDED